jgi:hypothetical protein
MEWRDGRRRRIHIGSEDCSRSMSPVIVPRPPSQFVVMVIHPRLRSFPSAMDFRPWLLSLSLY